MSAQALGVLVSPVLTRIYSPADFGLLAIFASIVGTFGVVTTLRYDIAIPVPRRDAAGANLLVLSLLAAVVVSTLSVGILWLLMPVISARSAFPARALLWLIPLGLLGSGAYQSLSFWAIRKNDYAPLARTKISQSLASALSKVGLGFLGVGAPGLAFGHVVGQSGGISTLGTLIWRRNRRAFRQITLGRVWAVAVRYRRYPLYASPAALFNNAGQFIAPILVASLYGVETAGLFALAQQTSAIPSTLIAGSVAQVYLGQAAKLVRSPVRLRDIFLNTSWKLSAVAILPTVLLAAFAPWLFSFVFGAQWNDAGVYVRLLSVSLFARFVVVPVAQNLNMLERQDLAALWSVLRLVTITAAFAVPFAVGWSAERAVMAYSITVSLLYVILLVMEFHAIRNAPSEAL